MQDQSPGAQLPQQQLTTQQQRGQPPQQEYVVSQVIQTSPLPAPNRKGQKRKRSPNWLDREVNLLLETWRDDSVQSGPLGDGHKKPVWEKIAAKMMENGYKRTREQCKEKLHQLESCYKAVKDKQRRTGEETLDSCPGFSILDEVLGVKPAIDPLCSIESQEVSVSGDDAESNSSCVVIGEAHQSRTPILLLMCDAS